MKLTGFGVLNATNPLVSLWSDEPPSAKYVFLEMYKDLDEDLLHMPGWFGIWFTS